MHSRLLLVFCLFILIFFNTILPQNNFKHAAKKSNSSGTDAVNVLIQADPFIRSVVDKIQQSNLTSEIQKLQSFKSRNIFSDSLNSSCNYLQERIASLGYQPELHNFTYNGKNLSNIAVTIPGRKYPDKIIIIGGHYDSISPDNNNAPGADDNASGIALILEAIRIFKDYDFDYTLKFLLFSAEEEGLIGSKEWVNKVAVPQSLNIILMINLDMIGGDISYQNTKIVCERDEDSSPAANNAASKDYTDTLASFFPVYSSVSAVISNAYASDYIPFENAGFVITGLFEQNISNHYHSTSDLLKYIDLNYYYQVAKGAIAAISHFGRIVKEYCTVYYTPQRLQPDSSDYKMELNVLSSSPVTDAQVFYKINGGHYEKKPLAFNSFSGDTFRYAGTIPAVNYGTRVKYFFYVQNKDSITALFPADTAAAFEYTVVKDSLPPILTGTIIPSMSINDFPLEITAAAKDDNRIKEVNFHYSVNGEEEKIKKMNHSTGAIYKTLIPFPASEGDSISYYYSAADNSLSNNISIFPKSHPGTFTILSSLLHEFETGDSSFRGDNDWLRGIPPSPISAYSGQNVWGTMQNQNYSDNTLSHLIFSADLNNMDKAFLSFRHYYNTQPGSDGGNISISSDGGNSFAILIPDSGYNTSSVAALNGPGYSGNSLAWESCRINLTPYTGRNVKIRFNFASDPAVHFHGWFIDDVRIDFHSHNLTRAEYITANPVRDKFSLEQNFPNPFNPTTKIRYSIGYKSFVRLSVYDITGKKIFTLPEGIKEPGRYETEISSALSGKMASGIYFYTIEAVSSENRTFRTSKKMILIK